YIRITVTGLEEDSWASFWEFKVSGNPSVIEVNDNMIGEGNNLFKYSDNWTYTAKSNTNQADSHKSDARGAYAEISFIGTQIVLYGAKGPDAGIAWIYIDGELKESIDLYAANRAESTAIYTSPVLEKGQHTLKIEV